MVDFKLIAKGGLIVLIIVSIAVLIERLTWSGSSWDDELDDSGNEVLPIKDIWPPVNNTDDSIYNENFVKCMRYHSESSYYPITQGKNISVSCIPSGRCIHSFLIHITRVLESLDLKLILIEPSLLFCLLPSTRKYNLLTRGFTSTKYKGSKNVVTFGVASSQAQILDEAKTRKRLASFRYKILRLTGESNSEFTNGNVSVDLAPQYLLSRYDMALHIIVLYPRETFLFSSAAESSELNVKGLLYVNNRAFENFTTSTSYLDTSSSAPVLLPSDSRCFLLDMMSSQFLECKGAVVDTLLNRNSETLMALKELKTVLASQMVIFWLWSKSLHGWYEKCNIKQYSDDLKFSVAAKGVENFNFSALFGNSSCEHIESYSDVTNNISNVELNCYGVKIQLIFMYEDKITYWTEYEDTENIYRVLSRGKSISIYGLFTKIIVEKVDHSQKSILRKQTLRKNIFLPHLSNDPGQPLKVFVEFKVIDIDEIDGAHMDYRLHMYIKLFWKDHRLKREDNLTSDCSLYVWTPDIMFETAKSIQSFDAVPTDFRIETTGLVAMIDRYSFKANCIMDFRDYPFDTQDCTFSVVFMTTKDDVALLRWINDTSSPFRDLVPIKFVRDIQPLQYRLEAPITYYTTRELTYGNYTYLMANFTLVRRLTGIILTIYIPTALVVTVSWVTFWLKPEAAPARVSLSITSLLTLCTQVQQYKSHLPPVNYITAMDIWLFVCIFVVFSTLLEFALCYNAYIEEKENENKVNVKETDQPKHTVSSQEPKVNSWTEEKSDATELHSGLKNVKFDLGKRKLRLFSFRQIDSRKMDNFCRTFFPAAFLVFTVIYWIYFESTSN